MYTPEVKFDGDNKIVITRDRTYYINEKKRTIVCRLMPGTHAVVRYISDKLCINLGCGKAIHPYLLKTEYFGKAKCDAEDKWDEALGKRLAADRAMYKYYSDFYKKLSLFESHITAKLVEKEISVMNKLLKHKKSADSVWDD